MNSQRFIDRSTFWWLLILFLVPSFARAASVTLQWNANSESDLAGYYLNYGTTSRGSQTDPTIFHYANKVDVGNVTTFTVSTLSGSTTYYFSVTAYDTSRNESTYSILGGDGGNGEVSATTPDLTAPVRSNGAPTGTLSSGTTSSTISLDTNETATCKYSTSAGVAYASMPSTFSSTNSIHHSSLVTGLLDGQTKNYYVRCIDMSGNANSSDFTISFSINIPANHPPVISTFIADKTSGIAPLSVSFTCSATDADGDSLSYNLAFGDGHSSAGNSGSNTYMTAGNYSATCTVTDGRGGSAMQSIAISVSAPVTPTPTPTAAPSVTPIPNPTGDVPSDTQASSSLNSSFEVSSGGCGRANSGNILICLALAMLLVGYRRRETFSKKRSI